MMKMLDIQAWVDLVYASSVCKSICDNSDSNVSNALDGPSPPGCSNYLSETLVVVKNDTPGVNNGWILWFLIGREKDVVLFDWIW